MDTVTSQIDRVQALLAHLDRDLTGFKVFLKHAIPDFFLLHLGIDVLEQGGAVVTIARGHAPRAAVANARSAFEASLDMLVLLAEPTLYDEMAAFARVCELLSWEDLRRKRVALHPTLGLEAPQVSATPESTVEEECKKWEEDSPGVGTMYRRVLAQARADVRWKHHWSGKSTFVERAQVIANKWNTEPGFVETAGILWGLQSIHTHPGARTGMRAVKNEGGQASFRPKPTDAMFPCAAVAIACEHAIKALKRRTDLIR